MGFWNGVAASYSRHLDRMEQRRMFKEQQLQRYREMTFQYLLEYSTVVSKKEAEAAERIDAALDLGFSEETAYRLEMSDELDILLKKVEDNKDDVTTEWIRSTDEFVRMKIDEEGGGDLAGGLSEALDSKRDGDDDITMTLRVMQRVQGAESLDELLTLTEEYKAERRGDPIGAPRVGLDFTQIAGRDSETDIRISKDINREVGRYFEGGWEQTGDPAIGPVFKTEDREAQGALENLMKEVTYRAIAGGMAEGDALNMARDILSQTYTNGRSIRDAYRDYWAVTDAYGLDIPMAQQLSFAPMTSPNPPTAARQPVPMSVDAPMSNAVRPVEPAPVQPRQTPFGRSQGGRTPRPEVGPDLSGPSVGRNPNGRTMVPSPSSPPVVTPAQEKSAAGLAVEDEVERMRSQGATFGLPSQTR